MRDFLLHSLTCGFWCFFWHTFHHWRGKQKVAYEAHDKLKGDCCD